MKVSAYACTTATRGMKEFLRLISGRIITRGG